MALDGLDDEVMPTPPIPAVSALSANGEHLEPDALEVDPDDVLPGSAGDQRASIVFESERGPDRFRRRQPRWNRGWACWNWSG
ncbi:MAG: hypothetical protein EDR02_13805 [Actinobacteria bacterium]|nr:MAG: hypothetical protein EDR02_13805 [Actinomycetota bacterium]RIK04496.1 MAG: hypothetical protein DCC48_13300 [Acidobacteriota bacterium]